MFEQGTRFRIQKERTPPEVNPFTYMLDDPYLITRKNHVPFLSSSTKKPPPGVYTDAIYGLEIFDMGSISSRRCSLPKASSMQNKSKRFVCKVDDSPSPTAYDPKLIGKRKQPPNTPIDGKGKLYLCKVPFSLRGSAPSIPTKVDENGYEIGPKGIILKIPPNRQERYINPASYNVQFGCLTSELYQGCKWSRKTSKRVTIEGKKGPGPTDYEYHLSKLCRTDKNEDDYRELAKRLTFLPRYIEDKQLKLLKDNKPGPGYYKTPESCFTHKPDSSICPRPFVIGDQRFKHRVVKGPSPATYTIERSIQKIPVSYKNYPFTVKEKRFKGAGGIVSPGPAKYNIKGTIQTNVDKTLFASKIHRAPFDTSIPRDMTVIPATVLANPGPAHYDLETKDTRCKIKTENSVFASKTDRFLRSDSISPGAGKYNLRIPFKKLKNPTSHNKKLPQFLFVSKRTSIQATNPTFPGPAAYLSQKSIEGKGYRLSTTNRFPDEPYETIAPNRYRLHTSQVDSMARCKMSYNLLVTEQIIGKSLRVHPKFTHKQWAKDLRKSKKLSCFQRFDPWNV